MQPKRKIVFEKTTYKSIADRLRDSHHPGHITDTITQASQVKQILHLVDGAGAVVLPVAVIDIFTLAGNDRLPMKAVSVSFMD